MKLVNAALAQKNLKLEQLSEGLRNEVASLRTAMFNYNVACEAFEELEESEREEAEEKRLDAMEHDLAEMEKVLSDKIAAFLPEPPAPIPTPEPAPIPTPEPTPPAPVEKKEDNSLGWLIFAGVAAAVTFGAVNLFKKRG